MAPNSSDVSAGDDVLASQYNNMRLDLLNNSSGHTHDDSATTGKPVTKIAVGATYESAPTGQFVPPIQACDLVPLGGSTKLHITAGGSAARCSDTTVVIGTAAIKAPHGSIITDLTFAYRRNDAASAVIVRIYDRDGAGDDVLIATITADDSGGSLATKSSGTLNLAVSNDGIEDNFFMTVEINPNDSTTDCEFFSLIATITKNPIVSQGY